MCNILGCMNIYSSYNYPDVGSLFEILPLFLTCCLSIFQILSLYAVSNLLILHSRFSFSTSCYYLGTGWFSIAHLQLICKGHAILFTHRARRWRDTETHCSSLQSFENGLSVTDLFTFQKLLYTMLFTIRQMYQTMFN